MSNDCPDRVSADLRAYEARRDAEEHKSSIANRMASDAFKNGDFDSDTIRAALGNKDAAWWTSFENALIVHPTRAGVMLASAVIAELSNQYFEEGC